MKIRKATIEDAQNLFDWRNDSETRANSIETGEILWENHINWLQKSLLNPMRDLYIIEDDQGASCGTIRLDNDGDGEYEISWTVAPEFRGKGIGKKMTKKFFDEYLKDKKRHVIARVKKENIASIKMIESLGFFLEDEKDGLQSWIW